VRVPSRGLEDSEERARAVVTEGRPGSACQHSGEPVPILGHTGPPNGVYASMHRMQTVVEPMLDRGAAESERPELSQRDNAVLRIDELPEKLERLST
jgi:hypothetical protein